MNKTTSLVLLITGAVLLGTATGAVAQPPPPSKNIFVDVNFGSQPMGRTISTQLLPVVYGEVAIVRTTQEVGGSPFLDVTAGYRVWNDFSVALGLTTTFSGKDTSQVVGGIPHPLFFDRRVESTQTAGDLAHREQSAHLSFMWTSPVTDKIDASAFFGPSYIKVYQDLVTSVTVTPGTQIFTPASDEETDTMLGVHFGGDITYLIAPRVGIGGMVRFVKATADLPSFPDLDVAGFQVGGGLRVRF